MPDIVFQVFKQFFQLLLTVLPYFLVGAVTGALMEAYLGARLARRYFGRGAWSVAAATVLGAILPGCSCATMPMAEGMKRSGARLGTVAAFIMVSPLLSPQTVILTYAMLGAQFAAARVILSLAAGMALGLAVNHLESRGMKSVGAAPASEKADCGCCADGETHERPKFWGSLLEILKHLSVYFLLGLFIASLLMTLVPEESIPKYIGSSGPLAYLVAAAVGIPLYVCEGEEIPITRALLDLGFGAGPSLTFLLGSVGTCIPTMLMARRTLGKRTLVLYLTAWPIFTVGSGLMFGLLYRS